MDVLKQTPEEVERRLRDQIAAGEELLSQARGIETDQELNAGWSGFHRWSDFTIELLKLLFSDQRHWQAFARAQHFSSVSSGTPPKAQRGGLTRALELRLNELGSLIECLPLMIEADELAGSAKASPERAPAGAGTVFMESLHPSIRAASSSLLSSGHYAQAVLEACKALQHLARSKSGRSDLDGEQLFGIALSDKKPLLILGDLATETGRNLQAGYRFLGMGIMRAFRNPNAHELQDIASAEAREMLGTISLLARQVERAEVIAHPEPTPSENPGSRPPSPTGRMKVGPTPVVMARLLFFYEPEFPMWWEKEGYHRIGVRNESAILAENVEVKLERMEPSVPLERNVLPSLLGRKGGRTDDCRINPYADDYFDILQEVPPGEDDGGALVRVSPLGPRSLKLWTVESAGQVFELDPRAEYRWTLRVSAANAKPEIRTLLVRHPMGGHVQLELLPATTT